MILESIIAAVNLNKTGWPPTQLILKIKDVML
jgi:hypothetical protein